MTMLRQKMDGAPKRLAPFSEKAGGRYAAAYPERLPARLVRFRRYVRRSISLVG